MTGQRGRLLGTAGMRRAGMSRPRLGRSLGVVSVLAALGLAVAGCGSAHAAKPAAVRSGGSLTIALDEVMAGFNSLENGDNQFVLTEVMDQTLPRVFIAQPDLKLKLNTEVVSRVDVLRNSPLTIAYHINPRAVWSDGVPITAADFIYNWKVQSGNPAFKDVGGKAFEPAATTGFNQIKSVTSSDHGRTATLVFSTPYSDWRALFSQNLPLIPAHVAEKVGFDAGFQKFGPAVQVSGGPYEIQSYVKNKEVVEVRNPHYWGPAGKLSKIIFRFIGDPQELQAVQHGTVNVINPELASASYLKALTAVPGFRVSVQPSLEFQHLDFNEANPYLAKSSVRHALAYGTNRAEMISRIVNPLTHRIGPLQNLIFMPTEAGYVNESDGQGNFEPARAEALLRQSGMTRGPDGYFHPDFGPEKGQDFTLRISTTTGVPVRSEIEQLFQANMKAIGVKVVIRNYSAAELFGTIAPKGEFDVIEFAWIIAPFKSESEAIYCSYTSPACAINWDHYSDPTVDSLFNRAVATTNQTQATALYNRVARLLWTDMVSLPLFQDPDLFGWSGRYLNVVPNTSNIGIPWNASEWGLK